MPDARAHLGHSMVTQVGTRFAGELEVIDLLARPERFELPTSWFVAMRSIQLSYGRAAQWRATDRKDQSGGSFGDIFCPTPAAPSREY